MAVKIMTTALKHMVIFTLLVTLYENQRVVHAAQMLRYLVGMHQTYRDGDSNVKLEWLLSPHGSAVYFMRCNHSSLFNGSKAPVFNSSNISSGQLSTSEPLRGRATAHMNEGSIVVNLLRPMPQDEGWYFCEMNTGASMEVSGAIRLSRVKDHLVSVKANDSTFSVANQTANISWYYQSKYARVMNITCYYRSNLQSWKTIAKYDVKKEICDFTERHQPQNPFLLRISCAHEREHGLFRLVLQDLAEKDKGEFRCDFWGEKRKIPSTVKLQFIHNTVTSVPLASTTSPSSTSYYPKVASVKEKCECVSWIISFGFCLGIICLMVITFLVWYFWKRYRQASKPKTKSQDRNPDHKTVHKKVQKSAKYSKDTKNEAKESTVLLPESDDGQKSEEMEMAGKSGRSSTTSETASADAPSCMRSRIDDTTASEPNPSCSNSEHIERMNNDNNDSSNSGACEKYSVKQKQDTREDMDRVLYDLGLQRLSDNFHLHEIVPSQLKEVAEDIYRDVLKVEAIGDFIRLRHYSEQHQRPSNSSQLQKISDVLHSCNLQDRVKIFEFHKISPEDLIYLTKEHFEILGVKKVGLQIRLKQAVEHESGWKSQCSPKVSSKTKSLPPKEKTCDTASLETYHIEKTKEIETDQNLTEFVPNSDVYKLVIEKFHDIFHKDKVASSDKVGGVVLSQRGAPTVVCLAAGTRQQNHISVPEQESCPHSMPNCETDNLLQECFSRFILEQIQSKNETYIVGPQDGIYRLRDDVQVDVCLSSPPCVPVCLEVGGAEQTNTSSNCGQQILLWQILGFQDVLLSHIFAPVYISTLFVYNACHKTCTMKSTRLQLSKNTKSKMPQAYSSPLEMKILHVEKRQVKEELTDGVHYKYWYKGEPNGTIVLANGGHIVGKEAGAKQERSKLGYPALLNLLKMVYVSNSDILDEELKKGSLQYQKALELAQEDLK